MLQSNTWSPIPGMKQLKECFPELLPTCIDILIITFYCSQTQPSVPQNCGGKFVHLTNVVGWVVWTNGWCAGIFVPSPCRLWPQVFTQEEPQVCISTRPPARDQSLTATLDLLLDLIVWPDPPGDHSLAAMLPHLSQGWDTETRPLQERHPKQGWIDNMCKGYSIWNPQGRRTGKKPGRPPPHILFFFADAPPHTFFFFFCRPPSRIFW